MTLQEYLQSRPDLQNNWNNVEAYRANPNDPRWANDPNVANLANAFPSLEAYLQADYGQPFAAQAPTTSPAAPSVPDFTQLVQPTTPEPNLPQFNSAPTFGGNFATSQVGGQSGAYSSQGQTAQTQAGQQTQTQEQTQQQTGTTTGQTTSTSGVNVPFDLNALVNSEIAGAQGNDATARGFLSDFVNTGGSAFGSQVDQAVRQSLTGPQMTGAGDSARARAAGYAASNVARGNAGQRLQAAELLQRPTGTASTVSSYAPLFGTTNSSTSTGTQASTSNLQNVLDTVDFQKLVGQESTAGTATGQSSQQSGGLAPQGQPVKTGGCVVCTAFVAHRMMKPGAVRRAVRWKTSQRRFDVPVDGYMLYGPFMARAVLSSPHGTFSRILRPIARAILYHEVYLSSPTRLRWRLDAYITHGAFNLLSWPVGLFSRLLGLNTGVRCKKVRDLLRKQNLEFTL